jgi:hypothetical protein
MAVIYLRHPRHGAKVACTDWEAAYDEQNGWERYDPTVPAAPAVVEATPAADENMLRVRRKRRFDTQEGA